MSSDKWTPSPQPLQGREWSAMLRGLCQTPRRETLGSMVRSVITGLLNASWSLGLGPGICQQLLPEGRPYTWSLSPEGEVKGMTALSGNPHLPHPCMWVYKCTCVCMCVHVCGCACMWLYVHTSMYMCMQVYICVWMHPCICMRVCIYAHIKCQQAIILTG